MRATLGISSTLSLPIDAVTQTIAAIGRKGAGKTYLATMLAEQMLDNEAQVVAIDPVGNWWGLRVGKDGHSKGKDIFVIGGEHGDVPLVPEAGAKIARLLVEKRVSAVLDISSFRQGERKRFAWEFAEEFFHLKKTQRSPVHLFVEEAQLFIPQRVGPDEARMVGAFENIIRLGRNYGVGATLVTQRPQSVNKEVLSQVECLCVLQVNGTHERKAIEEWVQEHGADRKLVGELPGLARGVGYVWSPGWLRIFQKVTFAQKETFDASATPEVGRATKAALLSKIDVEALRVDLQEVVAQAEKDDPKALRRQIAELQKQLMQRPKETAVQVQEKIVEVPVVTAEQIKSLSLEIENLRAVCDSLGMAFAKATQPRVQTKPKNFGSFEPAKPIVSPNGNGDLSGPEQRILDAIAWLNSIGVEDPEQTAVAFLAGYTIGGGAFNNPRGRLNQRGFVEYFAGDKIRLTDAGRRHASEPDTPLNSEELQRKVFERLPGPESKILRELIDAYPQPLSNDELATRSGYAPNGGAYNNPRGRLRTLGLIEYERGMVVARDLLFI